ncbi:hypothetical protein JCM16408A_28150 [Methylobacterium phyllosphaerae]
MGYEAGPRPEFDAVSVAQAEGTFRRVRVAGGLDRDGRPDAPIRREPVGPVRRERTGRMAPGREAYDVCHSRLPALVVNTSPKLLALEARDPSTGILRLPEPQ